MAALFVPGHGSMDYQSVYAKNGKYNQDYIDFTNYNYGVVAAAAGYSREEVLRYAGYVNLILGREDTFGPAHNKVQNAEMMSRGYDDYKAGRIFAPSK